MPRRIPKTSISKVERKLSFSAAGDDNVAGGPQSLARESEAAATERFTREGKRGCWTNGEACVAMTDGLNHGDDRVTGEITPTATLRESGAAVARHRRSLVSFSPAHDRGGTLDRLAGYVVILAVCCLNMMGMYCGSRDLQYVHPRWSHNHMENNLLIWMIGVPSSAVLSFVLAMSCFSVTFLVTYCDSVKPGIYPPTPMSPRKLREKPGHTLHLNYIMPLLNGAAVFVCVFWWSDVGSKLV